MIQQSSQLGLHQLVPSQDFPSKLRKYPELQVHTDDPGVFTQLWSQPPLLVSHSSMSKKVQKISNSQVLFHTLTPILAKENNSWLVLEVLTYRLPAAANLVK